MPEVRLKQLYMAASLESLNQKVSVNLDARPKLLIKSAQTVLSNAESSDKNRDEELAYIYFMRYFSIIKIIQQHDEYKSDKKFYDSMLNPKNTKKIIQRAEELSKSLDRRYHLLASINLEEKKEKEKEWIHSEMEEESEVKQTSLLNPSIAKICNDGFLACDKLYSLSKEKVSSFLIVDIRPKEEFISSSMRFSTVINIPEELLKPGLTANKAGRELDETNRLLWGRRHTFDYIIICDWTTDNLPFPPSITVLIDAIDKWDPGKAYRATPLVLKGGYEMFSLMYPMLVSNPRLNHIPRKPLTVSYNSPVTEESDSILNLDFPDLDTGFLSTPSPDRSIAYPPLKESLIPIPDNRSLKIGGGTAPPSINRDLKPKLPVATAAIRKEESLDFVSDVASSSSSISAMNNAMIADSRSPSFDHLSSPLPIAGDCPSSTSSSSPDTEDDEGGGAPPTKKESFPAVPSRVLKPQELFDSLKAKKKDLDEEQSILEQSFKAEKDALDKLQEVEETRRCQEKTQDEKTMLTLMAKEVKLREELEEKKDYMQEMERKYSFLHQQNEEMRKLLTQFFSGQLKIDTSESPVHMNSHQKEEKETLRINEEKKNALLLEVEELRRKRREKEKAMREEEERKRVNEEKKKEMEEAKEHQRWATERNSRNRENLPGDFQSERTPPAKKGGETYTTKLRASPRSSPIRGGSNMKRSHSALNLSQLRDDAGFDSSPIVPNFDRNLKPLNSQIRRNVNAARHRNFEPKYGSVGPTKTGLKNLGNTCYMNSIIQCLSNTFPFAKYFLEGHYSDDLNAKSKQRGEVAEEVGAVVRALWCGQYRSIAMWDLKSVVGRFHKAFQGYDQHDSHEFLIKLMDWLHDDLNLICIKLPKMEEQNFAENIRDEVAAQTVIDALRERDESVIRHLFHGLHRSVIVCHTCNHRSLTFEPFSVLTVSFPVSGRCTLKDMLYDFYGETRIEYKCAKCRRMRNCTRKFDIWKLPPILVIHLNRFEHDVLMKKKQNFVDFPLENLNLLEYTAGPTRHHSYDLYGVSNHYGTIDGGHYTAFCKSPNKSWYKFDDHEVYDLPRESVRTSAAYILFYETSNSKASL